MKTNMSIPIVILTFGFMLPFLVFSQEKAATPAPNPFQALPANPSLVQQIEAVSLKFDEAFNKHDGDAVVALFTTTATQVSPVGTFIGREAIEKYYGDLFQNLQPHGRATKINYVLMCLPSMPESTADLETGDAGGIQPVNVWFG
jgi:SnoaL-like domain